MQTIAQIHSDLKSDPQYMEKQNRISEIIKDPYYIPSLSEVREMVTIWWWFSSDYDDHQIKLGLKLAGNLPWFHNFLVEKDGQIMPSYDMPWTFVFGPLVEYVKHCYNKDELNEIRVVFTYLSNLVTAPHSPDDSSYQIVEGFLNRFEFDDKTFRERIMSDFPEGALKEYIKTRFQDIYL